MSLYLSNIPVSVALSDMYIRYSLLLYSMNVLSLMFHLFMPKGTLSEATLVAMLAARHGAINTARANHSELEDLDDAEICSRLVAYCSDQVMSR